MIVTAALATALGALPAAMPQTPTAAAIPPDSQSLRSHAEALQARFERLRLRAMPRTLSGGSQRCDAVIGRLCIWDDGPDARRPPPEPVETRLARLDLLVALDSVAQGIAGDHWVFGQRIRYLIEAERHADAAALARSCGLPTRWRCDAFLGYAHHRAGRVALAETAFRRTLRSMPPQLRKEWTDPAPLLDGDLRDWLALQPDSAAAVGRIWTLADPLFLVRGNDRWTRAPGPARPRPQFGGRAQPPSAALGRRPGRSGGALRLVARLGAVLAQVRKPVLQRQRPRPGRPCAHPAARAGAVAAGRSRRRGLGDSGRSRPQRAPLALSRQSGADRRPDRPFLGRRRGDRARGVDSSGGLEGDLRPSRPSSRTLRGAGRRPGS